MWVIVGVEPSFRSWMRCRVGIEIAGKDNKMAVVEKRDVAMRREDEERAGAVDGNMYAVVTFVALWPGRAGTTTEWVEVWLRRRAEGNDATKLMCDCGAALQRRRRGEEEGMRAGSCCGDDVAVSAKIGGGEASWWMQRAAIRMWRAVLSI